MDSSSIMESARYGYPHKVSSSPFFKILLLERINSRIDVRAARAWCCQLLYEKIKKFFKKTAFCLFVRNCALALLLYPIFRFEPDPLRGVLKKSDRE
jgi:hypothetical protein